MKKRKGSLTVEAVLVVPACLAVMFVLLTTGFYLHNRSWYAMAALSCAYSGTQKDVDVSAATARWEQLKNRQSFPEGNSSAVISDNGNGLQVKINGSVYGVWGMNGITFQVYAERDVVSPAEVMRLIK